MTKEKLKSYRALKMETDQLRERLEEVQTSLYSPRAPQLTGMPSGGSHSGGLEGAVARLTEIEELYQKKLEALTAAQLAVERAIEGLPSMERQLMRARYVDGLSWEAVCVVIGYSWQQTHRIHARALAALAEVEEED